MKTQKGFTIVELIIAVLIIAILAALAIAIYTLQVKQGRRADGVNALISMSLAEEQYRMTNLQYGTLAQVWSGVTASTGGYYTLAISGVSGTGYTLTATAQGAQAGDTEGSTSCATLQLTMSSGTLTRTPAICWPQ